MERFILKKEEQPVDPGFSREEHLAKFDLD